jgi:hypothetical protein
MTSASDVRETFVVVPGHTGDRTPIFSVLVKRTYDLRNGRLTRAATASPLVAVDQYFNDGDPEWTSVRQETDLVPYKMGTDVVFIGRAYAPGGEPVYELDATIAVDTLQKSIRIIGDRRCERVPGRPPLVTDPVPFTEMELRYERAYGGRDFFSIPMLPFYYPRNFVGSGLALKDVAEVVDGLALPNLEDAADLLTPERIVLESPTRWSDQPLPQGFGWVHRAWYPRCSFAGAFPPFVEPDAVLREEELGLVPEGQIALARQLKLPSFDVRFANGASTGLVHRGLRGDETVTLTQLTPEGGTTFALPGDRPRVALDIGLGQNELPVVLQTLCIRGDEGQVDLVWRGAHAYPGVDWLPEMKRMQASVW